MHERSDSQAWVRITTALTLLSAALAVGPPVAKADREEVGCNTWFYYPDSLKFLRVSCTDGGTAGTGRTNSKGFVETHLATAGHCPAGLQAACQTVVSDLGNGDWEQFNTVPGTTESRQLPIKSWVWAIKVNCGCFDFDSPD